MLVSLAATEELDFRARNYGRIPTEKCKKARLEPPELASGELPDSREAAPNRLPYVLTNPPNDFQLLASDLVFVLGRGHIAGLGDSGACGGKADTTADGDKA